MDAAATITPATGNLCPICGEPLAPADININEGVALCRACGKVSRLADVASAPVASPEMLAVPPAGCGWAEEGPDIVVRASLRSLSGALGALAVTLFWNGIVSVFVVIAFAGLYMNLIGPLPAWFPAPTMKGGTSGQNMTLGMSLFLCLFLVPFVAIGTMMFLAFLACVAGQLEVRLSGAAGTVRTSIGPFGWTRRFDAASVKRVSAGQTSYTENGRTKPLIAIEADRTVKFGSMLPDDRRNWMIAVLHVLLVAPPAERKRLLGGR